MCGLRNEAVQQRLLSEGDLTYAKAVEIAQAMEAADKNAREFHSTESGIKRVSTSPSSAKKYHRCNRTGHSPNRCKFKEATCHKCKGKGHIAPACRTKKALTVPSTEPSTTSGDTHKTHQMMSEC